MSNSDIVEEFHEYNIHFPSGTIYLGDDIDGDSSKHVIKNLHMLNRAGKEINLIINSDGGDAYHGRGYIQLTHDYNYKEFGDKVGVDLLSSTFENWTLISGSTPSPPALTS